MKKTALLAVLLALCIAFAGCQQNQPSSTPQAENPVKTGQAVQSPSEPSQPLSTDVAASPAATTETGKHEHEHEHDKEHEHNHSHTAPHGGVLGCVERCGIGHAELKMDGEKVNLWFVGADKDTTSSVTIPDKEVTLTIKPKQGKPWTVVLKAAPIELADEKVGNCSHFEGQDKRFAGLASFEAESKVNFKGQLRSFEIDYPGETHKSEHEHDHEHEGHSH